ncbi:hypothetical protein REPUB_Repub06bG0088200 [Reevesia pubescens]
MSIRFAIVISKLMLYHISSLEAMDFLDKFLSMSPDASGCIKLQDFSRVLQLKACTLSEKFGLLYAGLKGVDDDAGRLMPTDQNVLHKHVALLDRNHDGLVYP